MTVLSDGTVQIRFERCFLPLCGPTRKSDRVLPTEGFAQGSVDLDVVPVATALLLLVHTAAKVRSSTMAKALRSVMLGLKANVSEPHLGILSDTGENSGMVCQKSPFRT